MSRERGKSRGPVRIDALVGDCLAKVIDRHGPGVAALVQAWTEIAGPELGRLTRPRRLRPARKGADGGVLEIRCEPAAALEVQHMAPVLAERVNGILGYWVVARLKVVQGTVMPPVASAPKPAPPSASYPPIDEARLQGVENEELRKSLAGLGRRIAADDPAKT